MDPEVNRRKFRGVNKLPTVTYLKLSRECVMKADKWTKAANVKPKEGSFRGWLWSILWVIFLLIYGTRLLSVR